jgi:hypothetical protein
MRASLVPSSPSLLHLAGLHVSALPLALDGVSGSEPALAELQRERIYY